MTKMEGTFIGQHAGKTQGPVPITWKDDNITVLGTKHNAKLEEDNDKTGKEIGNLVLKETHHKRESSTSENIRTSNYYIYLATIFRPLHLVIS